jgi:hypothetical protein
VEEDFDLIKDWYEANPDVEEKPIPVFPVDLELRDGTIVTVNSQEEMHELLRDCHGHHGNGGNGNGGGNG